MATVEFGNDGSKFPTSDGAHAVTYVNVPDTLPVGEVSAQEIISHLWQNPDITHLPGSEAVILLAHSAGGVISAHTNTKPTWVESDNPQLDAVLKDLYQVGGKPEDVHETHWTWAGAPGIIPAVALVQDIQNTITATGRDIFSRQVFGQTIGAVGTSTAVTSTSLTNTGATFLTTGATLAGFRVFTGAVWGLITSNTSTILYIDRWYNPATPGGAAGSTPSTGSYIVSDGAPPAWFMALTATTGTPVAGEAVTSLPGEIVTGGGGLVRQIATYAHTAGTTGDTISAIYTANGSDSLPVTIARIGLFNSMVVGATPTMFFDTNLTTSAVLSASGDQLTVTDTITQSP